jgi:hypothetical protein
MGTHHTAGAFDLLSRNRAKRLQIETLPNGDESEHQFRKELQRAATG